jgi:hypothetical protein
MKNKVVKSPKGLNKLKSKRGEAFGPKVTKAKAVKTPSKPYG